MPTCTTSGTCSPAARPSRSNGDPAVRYATYVERNSVWMGDRCPSGGLFFPFPKPGTEMGEINQFLYDELQTAPRVTRVDDDPAG